MATGAPDANGIWIYGEDDSEATFSALLNKLGNSTSSALTTKLNALPGKILQVVWSSTSTTVTNTTTTYADTGLTRSITPISATSKLIVIGSQNIAKDAIAGAAADLKLLRDSGDVYQLQTYGLYSWGGYGRETLGFTFVGTSSNTSATTFKTQFRRSGGTSGDVKTQIDGSTSTLTIIEVSQ